MHYCPGGQTADDEAYSPYLFEATIDGTSPFGRRDEAGQDVLHDIVGRLFLIDGAKRPAERVQFRYILVLRVCVFRERAVSSRKGSHREMRFAIQPNDSR
jgi:hypothetical protein